jgi:hypothetical protein
MLLRGLHEPLAKTLVEAVVKYVEAHPLDD